LNFRSGFDCGKVWTWLNCRRRAKGDSVQVARSVSADVIKPSEKPIKSPAFPNVA
jgi:hypothetical protein